MHTESFKCDIFPIKSRLLFGWPHWRTYLISSLSFCVYKFQNDSCSIKSSPFIKMIHWKGRVIRHRFYVMLFLMNLIAIDIYIYINISINADINMQRFSWNLFALKARHDRKHSMKIEREIEKERKSNSKGHKPSSDTSSLVRNGVLYINSYCRAHLWRLNKIVRHIIADIETAKVEFNCF